MKSGLTMMIGVMFLLCFTSCEKEQFTQFPFDNSNIETIGTTEIIDSTESDQIIQDEKDVFQPYTSIDPQLVIIQGENINLDLDTQDEQVLFVKKRSDEDSPLELIILDYDEIRGEYVISWQAQTRIETILSLNFVTMDLTGDHLLEMVCMGTDFQGNEIIHCYKKIQDPDSFNLVYDEILSLSVEGSIEIEEKTRSLSYQKNERGDSFRIITLTSDPESQNLGDMVKNTYIWHGLQFHYQKTYEEKIQAGKILETQLAELLQKDIPEFEEFLDGAWIYTDSSGSNIQRMIFFNSDDATFSFYENDIQETFLWRSTYNSQLYNLFYIRGDNALARYIPKTFNVTVLSTEMISISKDPTWAGRYQRVSPALQKTLFNSAEQVIQKPFRQITGFYRSDEGKELYLSYPDFNLVDGEKEYSGKYSIYYSGVDIFELRTLDESGIQKSSYRYKFDFVEEQNETEIIRILYLIPGDLSLYGFIPGEQKFERFEQREILQPAEEEEQNRSSEE